MTVAAFAQFVYHHREMATRILASVVLLASLTALLALMEEDNGLVYPALFLAVSFVAGLLIAHWWALALPWLPVVAWTVFALVAGEADYEGGRVDLAMFGGLFLGAFALASNVAMAAGIGVRKLAARVRPERLAR